MLSSAEQFDDEYEREQVGKREGGGVKHRFMTRNHSR
jgi:hypothetical protein